MALPYLVAGKGGFTVVYFDLTKVCTVIPRFKKLICLNLPICSLKQRFICTNCNRIYSNTLTNFSYEDFFHVI